VLAYPGNAAMAHVSVSNLVNSIRNVEALIAANLHHVVPLPEAVSREIAILQCAVEMARKKV
jgi:hypothetical protein